MRRICVFSGSSLGACPEYAAAARRLGGVLAAEGLGVVYGGSSVGLMAELADAALAGGAEVIGVIPESLVRREVAHHGLSKLTVVETMHERKAEMARLSDAFVALPGGMGTLDELFEIVTWAQLGFHEKPCGLLNVRGYFDRLLEFLDHMVSERFVHGAHRDLVVVATGPEDLLEQFRTHRAPRVSKWAAGDRG